MISGILLLDGVGVHFIYSTFRWIVIIFYITFLIHLAYILILFAFNDCITIMNDALFILFLMELLQPHAEFLRLKFRLILMQMES